MAGRIFYEFFICFGLNFSLPLLPPYSKGRTYLYYKTRLHFIKGPIIINALSLYKGAFREFVILRGERSFPNGMEPKFDGLPKKYVPSPKQYAKFCESYSGVMGTPEQCVYWGGYLNGSKENADREKFSLGSGRQFLVRRLVYMWYCRLEHETEPPNRLYTSCNNYRCVNYAHIIVNRCHRPKKESDSKKNQDISQKPEKRKRLSKEEVFEFLDILHDPSKIEAVEDKEKDKDKGLKISELVGDRALRYRIPTGKRYKKYAKEYYSLPVRSQPLFLQQEECIGDGSRTSSGQHTTT